MSATVLSATVRMGGPLVSVGVPVYNGERYLREALASAVAQDYEALEIIVCDNASTDSTPDICRQFAAQHPRIRYLRNAENIGGSLNFARVLAEARGKYFTWLAHDDVLSDPGYLRAVCETMEANPDVVLCGSSMNVLGFEGPGMSTPAYLDPIYPDRDWRQARKRFFRCPFDSLVYFAIYGVYRRDVLASIEISERRYRGQRVVVDTENPILAQLATRGRIVALPELLRSYRHHDQSSWHADQDRLSGWDKFVLSLGMKARMLWIALSAPLSLGEKVGLVRVAFGNFFRHVFSAPTDYKVQIRQLKNEVLLLRKACAERLAMIEHLHAQCDARARMIEELQRELERATRDCVA